MKLWIGHYHLQLGGVTRIIQSQVTSLVSDGPFDEVAVISGTKSKIPIDARVVWDPVLNYMDVGQSAEWYRAAAEKMGSLLAEHVGQDDILHFHNPNIGKNPVLTHTLAAMASKGYRLMLHCHDFAEDRPDSMAFLDSVISDYLGGDLGQTMYPDTAQFGVLNSQDLDRMCHAGIDRSRITLLPNPVAFPEQPPGLDRIQARSEICRTFGIPSDRTVLLYPIRVIPRKNIGELILLASLFSDRATALVTLAPHNPLWRPAYDRWMTFAREIDAPVVFEASERMSFETLMYGADRMITTSVREGFGMMYLEPWLFDRPVVGRRIGAVVSDFEEAGMTFSGLYDSLTVETESGPTDFGLLEQDNQIRVIRSILSDPMARRRLVEALDARLFGDIPDTTIKANRKLIGKEYSLERYRDRLSRVYASLA